MGRDYDHWHGLTTWQANEYRRGKACQVCGSTKRLAVDHNHETGAIRGVLCAYCNLLVGLVEDNERLEAIKAYLDDCAGKPLPTAADFPKYRRPKLLKPVAEHGTLARYNHRSHPCRCGPCREAAVEWNRKYSGSTARDSTWGRPEHGTYAMYQAERKRGEQPCLACTDANRRYHNERNRRRRLAKQEQQPPSTRQHRGASQ